MNTGTLTLTPKKRWEILKRDNFVCQYCGARAPEARLHVDHVKARAMGGTNDDRNLITACELCNAGKRDAPMFKRWWRASSYAAAGLALEHIMPLFPVGSPAGKLWEVMDWILMDEEAMHRTLNRFLEVHSLPELRLLVGALRAEEFDQ